MSVLHERIARVCHEAYRAWQEVTGAQPAPHWEQAPTSTQARALASVKHALAGHDVHVPLGTGEEQARKLHLFHAVALALGCGKERWDVKTLTDMDAGKVNLTPVSSTVAELVALPAPVQPLARTAEEFNTYQVTGTITLAKIEQDSDIHMVLDDGQGHTMICEAVCPGCAAGSVVAAQIAAVRQIVEAQFPTVTQGVVERGLNLPVTVTGVWFADRLHGQDGVAPNGAELHPLLSFQVGAKP